MKKRIVLILMVFTLLAPGLSSASNLLLELVSVQASRVESYDRDEWGYWITRDGINTRGRVLIRDGAVDDSTGDTYWICPYTANRLDYASDVDIDHVVSLYDAHYSGGHRWSYAKRLEFYNDQENLLAVWDVENRRKSSDDPVDWSPPLESYRSSYAEKYRYVKDKWGLRVTAAQEQALQELM
jgi:hypothetical protein